MNDETEAVRGHPGGDPAGQEAEVRAIAEELYALDDDPYDGVGAAGLYLGGARFWHRLGIRPGFFKGGVK